MPDLFSPLTVKNLNFKNRVVLPPMATERSQPDGAIQTESIAYYQKMAARGMALLIVEHNFISQDGRASPGQMSIASNQTIGEHQKLAQAIRKNGVLAALQINHAGSNHQEVLGDFCLGASPVSHPVSHLTPRELTIDEIAAIITAFGQAAARAKKAAYDSVEIHCAHGFLLSQFLSPLTNRRQDQYGGTLVNRMRFLLETITAVRFSVGSAYPLMVRLGISDSPPNMVLHNGGLSLEEGIRVAQAIEGAGIDILDISGGLCGSRPAGLVGEAYFLPWVQALRPAVRLPLIITGGISKVETAAAIIKKGAADLVGVGRSLVADPEWINKAKSSINS